MLRIGGFGDEIVRAFSTKTNGGNDASYFYIWFLSRFLPHNIYRSFSSPQPPRSCDVYWAEFGHCKSLHHRFHHYYTYGTSPVCLQWKNDYEACREWERNRSPHAKESLQMSERNRVSEQKNLTTFWEMRQKPPADWHLPLDEDKIKDS